MQIHNNNSPNFTQLYVQSKDAKRLLKKADFMVKSSKAVFEETNFLDGKKLPLWSTLEKAITERQKDNPNHILINVLDKGKQLLQIKLLDNKGFTNQKWEINPLPKLGPYRDIYPDKDYYYATDYKNDNLYGKSDFYNLMDKIEFLADELLNKMLKSQQEAKTSWKALPKVKKEKRYRHHNILHTQRPFAKIRVLLEKENQVEKLKPSLKERYPRIIKKELKKADILSSLSSSD